MIKKFDNLRDFTNSNFIARNSLSLSIVNTEANGKRIRISPKLLQTLGTPEYIKILGNESGTGIYILPSKTGMKLNKGGTLYNSSLVQNLTKEYKLDFSEHTSYTYNNIKVEDNNGQKYAEIIMTKERTMDNPDIDNEEVDNL